MFLSLSYLPIYVALVVGFEFCSIYVFHAFPINYTQFAYARCHAVICAVLLSILLIFFIHCLSSTLLVLSLLFFMRKTFFEKKYIKTSNIIFNITIMVYRGFNVSMCLWKLHRDSRALLEYRLFLPYCNELMNCCFPSVRQELVICIVYANDFNVFQEDPPSQPPNNRLQPVCGFRKPGLSSWYQLLVC